MWYEISYALESLSGITMKKLSTSNARANLFRLIDQATESREPIQINGKRNSAIPLSESDWSAIQETLFLLGIPGMRESIREGMNTPVYACDTELKW